MAELLYLIDQSGSGVEERISAEALIERLKARRGPMPIVTLPESEDASVFLRELPRLMAPVLARQRSRRQEDRVDRLLEAMLDLDPLDGAESRIDVMNAKLRRDFLGEFEVLDAAGVHERSGHTGSNKAQTAAAWSRSGRILGLPLRGRTVYPAFQLDADGQPQPLLRAVLKCLRADLSAWQRAFWLVAPNEWLDGRTPLEAIAAQDKAVVDAARRTGAAVIG